MSKVELLHNEAIIMRDSAIRHDRGELFESVSDELVLTNLALIVVHKNFLGAVKDTQRFSLYQMKVVNGKPQVVSGRSKDGSRQLHVYFSHGIEAFTLGSSDEDADAGLLETLCTSQAEKENRNIKKWQEAITEAALVLMHGSNVDVANAAPVKRSKSSESPRSHHVTKKCIGCMAPLSGVQGQKVVCRYCDTEQAI